MYQGGYCERCGKFQEYGRDCDCYMPVIFALPGEQEFRDYILANRGLGFGRMMQIISFVWHEIDPIGAISNTGECYGSLSNAAREELESLKLNDPVNYKPDEELD